MAKQIAESSDWVYIPKLNQFGRVKTVRSDGRITKVIINTPTGKTVIDTVELKVIFAVLILGVAKWFVKLIKSLSK